MTWITRVFRVILLYAFNARVYTSGSVSCFCPPESTMRFLSRLAVPLFAVALSSVGSTRLGGQPTPRERSVTLVGVVQRRR